MLRKMEILSSAATEGTILGPRLTAGHPMSLTDSPDRDMRCILTNLGAAVITVVAQYSLDAGASYAACPDETANVAINAKCVENMQFFIPAAADRWRLRGTGEGTILYQEFDVEQS